MPYALKPLTLGELLDRTFSMYRTNFVLFMGIAALPNLFMLMFQLSLRLGRAAGPLFIGISSLALILVYVVALFLTQGATVIAVSNIQLGRPSTIVDAFRSVWPRIGELMLVGMNAGIRVLLGFLLLIVPGIVLMMKYSLAINVTVLEHTNVAESLERSADLTKGHKGRIFLIYFLLLSLIVVIGFVSQVVLALVFASIRGGHPSDLASIVTAVAGFVTQSLLGPIMTIALALVYYDERVRKEAFDLEHMMTQLDGLMLTPSPGTA